MFTTTATIEYKNSRWVVAEVDEEICKYYRNWVFVRYGVTLMGSRWAPHVTVVRSEEPPDKSLWDTYQGLVIPITYSHNVRRDRDTVFWWLDVESDFLLSLREELGLPRIPDHSFHITVGREHPTDRKSRFHWID